MTTVFHILAILVVWTVAMVGLFALASWNLGKRRMPTPCAGTSVCAKANHSNKETQ